MVPLPGLSTAVHLDSAASPGRRASVEPRIRGIRVHLGFDAAGHERKAASRLIGKGRVRPSILQDVARSATALPTLWAHRICSSEISLCSH
jgi:hypothetical protein